MGMKRLTRTVALASVVSFAALGLAACSSGSSATPDKVTAAEVVGVWGTPDTQGEAVVDLADNGEFGGNSGCNVIGGSWEVDAEGRLSFGPIHSTMMYCEGVDEWLLQASSAVVQGEKMVFSDENGKQLGTLERN